MEKSMRLQAVKRSALYWGRCAEVTVGIIFLISLFYGVFFTSFFHGGEAMTTVADIAVQLRFYIMMMGVMIPIVESVSYGSVGTEITVAFGGTRTEALWGMQWMNLLVNLQVFLIVAVINAIGKESMKWLAVYAAAVILVTAIGQFAVAANLKFGGKGVWLTLIIVVCMLIGVGLGMGTSFISDNFSVVFAYDNLKLLKFGITGMAIVGGVLYIIGVFLLSKILKKYEVRL